MDKKQNEIIKKVKKFIEKLGFVNKAILFGSFARGDYREESDVDLIIVSDYFSRLDEDDRLEILYRKTA